MSTSVSWRGAIEFAGFPVNVALYNRVKSARTESFKQIAPSGQPAKQSAPTDSATGATFDKALIRKGFEVSKGEYVVLSDADLEAIAEGQKTTVAKPDSFCPLASIALDLAINRYAIRPDDKVAGSEQSTNIVWNGLRSSGLAYVSQVAFRSGGMDGLLVIYADDQGMWGAMLPFEDELYDVPSHEFTVDGKAEKLFAQVVEQTYEVEPFDHGKFKSEYKARRKTVIDAVIAGTPTPAKTDEPQPSTPNLMAMLEAAVVTPKSKPAKAGKKSKEAVNA